MIKKYFKLLPIFSLAALPIISTSCSSNNEFVLYLSTPVNKGDAAEFVNSINELFKELDTGQKYTDLKFTYKEVSDDTSKKHALENGSGSFAFLKAQTLMSNSFYQQSNPLIQTLTTPFTFDLDSSKRYVDGSETDPLRTIAKEMQSASFGSNYDKPHKNWTDQMFDWNGIRYNKFYSSESKPVEHYRGMILLSGTDEQINKAKEYWNKKDWNNFRNMGIIVGEQNSVGNYKLQELLLQKHFNLNNLTLEQDKLNNPNKYKTDNYGTEFIGKDPNFVISFTDEASFAWTHRNDSTTGYSPRDDAKIEILTATDPSLYDIGTFSQYVDKELANLVSEAIIQTYLKNDNLYGEGLGYNGYKLIQDFDKEVVQNYNNTFNNQKG